MGELKVKNRNADKMSRRDFIVAAAVVLVAAALVGVGGCAKFREGVESMAEVLGIKADEGADGEMLKIALLQMSSFEYDQEANKIKGEQFCRQAKDKGADIALFPEMWNIGYTRFDEKEAGAKEQWQGRAIGRDSEFVKFYQRLAKELEMAIAITYLEKFDGGPRNSVSIIDRGGEIVMTYSKVHTCDFGAMETACSPGDDFYVCELDTAKGKVKVGAMICYDREAPESARILMLKGAELILTPNACELGERHINQFRTRAMENSVAVAMTNYPKPKNNGMSIVCDAGSYPVVEAGEKEGLFIGSIDLEKMRERRSKTIWGNAYRRPHRYGQLISDSVEEPFIRENEFGEPFERSER